MGFLTAVVALERSDGSRIDLPRRDGTRSPIAIVLGDEFDATAYEEGGFAKVLIEGGGGGGGALGSGTAFTSDRYLQGVAATPGWYVIGGFLNTEAEAAVLRATVIASTAALQVRVRLVRADTLVEVPDSMLTFAAPVNALEETLVSDDIAAELVADTHYQIQAECTGGESPTDFAIVRSAGLFAS